MSHLAPKHKQADPESLPGLSRSDLMSIASARPLPRPLPSHPVPYSVQAALDSLYTDEPLADDGSTFVMPPDIDEPFPAALPNEELHDYRHRAQPNVRRWVSTVLYANPEAFTVGEEWRAYLIAQHAAAFVKHDPAVIGGTTNGQSSRRLSMPEKRVIQEAVRDVLAAKADLVALIRETES